MTMYCHTMRLRRVPIVTHKRLWVTPVVFLAWVASVEATPFVPERVDLSSFTSQTSLAIDGRGRPHLVYQSATDDLKYAVKSGGTWVFETVDAVGAVGDEASIALDAQGNPHVSYYNATNGDLKYATKSGGTWLTEPVDTGGNVGSYTSIRIDSLGNPHISYWDQTNGDLKYARKASGVWSVEIVDAPGTTGNGTSLALDDRDAPRMAYWDVTNGDLRYASKAGGVWTLQTADAGGNVGAKPSLRLDSRGNPHISYKDVGLGDLKYASRSGSIAWTTELVDAGGNVGNHTSLWLDQDGNPRISYYDVTNTDLKYAAKSGVTWALETVDAGPIGLGQNTSLAFDQQGNPCISYIEPGQAPDLIPYVKFASSFVRVASQLAGVTWPVGSLRSVAWSGIGPVAISLSVDGGATYQRLVDGVTANAVELRVPHTPTKFARIRMERASPLSTSESDSLFTIQSSVTLLAFQASPAPGQGATVAWRTDPGPEDLAGYRLEYSKVGSAWSTLVSLTRETQYDDPAADPASRYRLFAVNGLGGEILLGETALRPQSLLAAWPLPYRGGELSVSFATGAGLGGLPAKAEVDLYNVRGRLVRRLAEGEYLPGYQEAVWDGRDEVGRNVPAGVYFLRVQSAGQERSLQFAVFR